ncbi:hypothetical protein GFS31_15640 [Leptolyngbya sp. BL0902]|uniref:hypothetical protein n=1 Tax=Leptolyngbya sp. BL0902 TaxID=1115757 RepID=UPI0018E84AD9|nr:hypothetical protein [Leptolyngbya sp. BL0902]QQE64881.1 hypothetical protein GFS31_15640 [Leptolyngbya sp. BL0902]
MDAFPHLALTPAPSAPGLEAILRPIVLEDALQVQSFLPTAAALESASIASAMPSSLVLAQQFDQDVLGDMGRLWNIFIESGQVWALLIGIAVGYFVRGLTAY